MDFYKCASVDASNSTWTGYKAVLSGGFYIFEPTVTSGLTYTSVTPEVGKVYVDGALVEANPYNGIPKNGLVFYAPLSSSQSKAATGQDLYTYGTVTYESHKGISAAKFTGSQRIYTSTSAGLPTGNSPWTISAWICPTGVAAEFSLAMVLGRDAWGDADVCAGIGVGTGNNADYRSFLHFVQSQLNLSA